jgi:hypothetical protein
MREDKAQAATSASVDEPDEPNEMGRECARAKHPHFSIRASLLSKSKG